MPKKRGAPKAPPIDYRSVADRRLQTEVTVTITARGKKNLTATGLLLAYLGPGQTIQETSTKVDSTFFKEMPEREYAARRERAEVCVVRVTDPQTGRPRYLTPRAQQVLW